MNFRRNGKVFGLALGIFLVMVMIPCMVLAVPQEIHYQGHLTDAEGNPVNDSMAMTFRIWDESSGGTQLWEESHEPVTLREGVFNVILGSSALIPSEILDGECYLGITVGMDAEMVPRQRFTSAPFALRAAYADDTGTLDGLDSTAFAEALHSHSFGDISGMPPMSRYPTASPSLMQQQPERPPLLIRPPRQPPLTMQPQRTMPFQQGQRIRPLPPEIAIPWMGSMRLPSQGPRTPTTPGITQKRRWMPL